VGRRASPAEDTALKIDKLKKKTPKQEPEMSNHELGQE
jgi:hypothetical protein